MTSRKAVTNENMDDENVGNTRVTRAKAVALGTSENDVKKPLTTKAGGATAAARKRSALSNLSTNASKNEGVKERKPLATKGGLAKAAQPSRVNKPARSASTRSLLVKEKATNSLELKRPASGSGAGGHASKKRQTTSASSVEASVKQEEEDKVEVSKSKEIKLSVEIIQSHEQEEEVTVTEDEDGEVGPSYEMTPPPQATDVVIPDLDGDDVNDPLMVSEYVGEIFEYLRNLEANSMPNANYMDAQTDLEWQMRGVLVDWLLEVHARFRLLPETMFLAVNIIDRFLSRKIVQLDRLQLVGVTALFIASKYEEVLSPHISNFRNVADNAFSEDEILSAERFVLAALDYDLSYPNPMNFLRRISKADQYDVQVRTVAKYLLEISCLDHRFLKFAPSLVAAAAMYLARIVLAREEWVSCVYSDI